MARVVKETTKTSNTGSKEVVKPASSFSPNESTEKLFAAINKMQSKNTVTKASDMLANDYGRLRTGILTIDLCLNGGLRRSRSAMLYGESSSGKTTLSLIMVARALRKEPDKIAVWVDVEGTMEADWAAQLGIDLDRFFVVQCDSGEEAVDTYAAFLANEQVCIVVLDSIAFLTPDKEIKSSASDALVGVHARLIGTFLRRVTIETLKARKRGHYPIALFINQYRTNIGQMFGDPRTLPGGRALRYAVSQGIEIKCKEHKAGSKDATGKKLDSDEDNGTVLFNEHTFTVMKDKTGGRVKEGKFKLIRDESMGAHVGYIEQTNSILSYARAIGLCGETGQNRSIEGFCTFKSLADLQSMLYNDPELQERICNHIVDHYLEKWKYHEQLRGQSGSARKTE